jgi:hypothetical protein
MHGQVSQERDFSTDSEEYTQNVAEIEEIRNEGLVALWNHILCHLRRYGGCILYEVGGFHWGKDGCRENCCC